MITERSLQEKFETFYNTYYPKALSFAVNKIQNRQDAEDLVGEAFLYCYDHFDEYDEARASFGTWLYIVVNTRVKKYYRDRKTTVPIEDLNMPGGGEDELTRAAELSEMRNVLAEALELLPETQRKIVILRYFRSMSTAQTAQVMQLSEGNVRTTLSRAIATLRKTITQKGYGY